MITFCVCVCVCCREQKENFDFFRKNIKYSLNAKKTIETKAKQRTAMAKHTGVS
jgi:hypothetical protein